VKVVEYTTINICASVFPTSLDDNYVSYLSSFIPPLCSGGICPP
jgi:hypothetical protein